MGITAGKISQQGVNYSKLRQGAESEPRLVQENEVEDTVENVIPQKVHKAVLDHKRMRMDKLAQAKGGRVSSYMNDLLINTDK